MSDQPPPPPPHGSNPRRSGPNMPPGKYDIFIIPPHSSGAGFLYLPSLKPNVNSFAAGFASALVLVVLFQSIAPAFRVWYRNFEGMGNMGMLLLVIAVGVGAWSVGRIQNEKGPSSGNRGDSRHSWSYNPGDNGHSGGSHPNSGPPPHSRGPDSDGPPPPPPPHGTPPPRSGPSPNPGGSDKPRSSWQERPQEHSQERSRERSQERPRERHRKRPEERPEEHPKERPKERPEERPEKRPEESPKERPKERSKEHPKERPQERPQQPEDRPQEKAQAENTKGTWERAREETRRKEEERKAKEAEQRKKDEIARRIRELRAKEARERAKREQEAKERREKEAREKEDREREIRERLEKEARIREEREREIREMIEKEERIRKERAEKEAREARERQEKEMQEAREKQEREAREKEQQAKEKREREQQEKARKEKELREKRLQEARERELRERLEREKTLRETLEREVKEREAKERETKEREAREREAKEREVRERIAARLKEVQAAKAAQEAKAKAQEAETPRRGTYAFSSVGEKTNPWPNGKPPTPAPSTTRSTATPSVAPTAAPSAAPSAASNSTRRPPPPTAQSFRGTDDDAYSYRPYDQPKSHTRRRSGETIFTESSYAASQSTSRTTPPPSMRGAYTTKDPDKIVIKAVYGFLNQFSKTPASQLLSGIGNVTDGLILRITTEGLFIDDDVRGVPQREWDVKAWTLKLMEVWCPAHTTADSNASPRVTNKSAPPRFKFSARAQSKALMGDDADSYLTELLHACKDDCRMGPHGGSDAASARGTSQGGEWKHRGLHVLRATIRDQEGKRYLFVLGEEEGWKVAVGLQRLRKGTQVRQLGIQSMSLAEARNSVEMLGW
ncbi:hypothetical protein F4678DRAFT_169349 [Xylaria arbuscula]|nr:hypothetical protein F4678DRAFT_169349 [Xylaria arbuscula]